MRARTVMGLVFAVGSVGWLACAGPTAPGTTHSDSGDLPRADSGVLYAMGSSLGERLQLYQFDEEEVREIERGLRDSSLRLPYAGVRTEETAGQVAAFHERRLQELARREELAGAPTLELAAGEPGAVKTESGIVLRVLDPGSGPSPTIFDYVTINYRGKLRDGSVFYTNDGAAPHRVQLGTTTRCWQEVLGSVAAGARVHAVCPPSMSYGWGGWPGVVPGGAVLTYDLELLSVEPQSKP
jgi:FKBP-type peptidyl-prolyl cis-trans isomerase FkpA